MGWPKPAKTKTPQAFWRPAAIGLVKILSQPQVRADRAKPIKEILAAGCVVHLLAVHEAKVTERNPQSSREAGKAVQIGKPFHAPAQCHDSHIATASKSPRINPMTVRMTAMSHNRPHQ